MFMKRKKLLSWSLAMVISLLLWGGGIGYAKVTGRCDGCHTMHNSQGGAVLYASGPYEHLLAGDCVGCHSSSDSSTTYALGTSTVPVVNYTGGVPATYLAGGNFYWVATAGGADDAKGHNVYGIADQDEAIITAEEAPGNNNSCGPGACHATLAIENATGGYLAPGGCQGCHLDVKHHANDGTGTKYVGTAPDKWYRFLAGHQAGAPDGTYGVEGIEDADWQATKGAGDHNEYKGLSGEGSGSLAAGSGTMTAFCSGCHGDFHSSQRNAADSEWIRHPSDFVIPNSGEYASMSIEYNPNVPVARTDAAMTALGNAPGNTVAASADMVMCLSCHRPHGSPYDDMLRWDYAEMVAGDSSKSGGCFVCHTAKND